MFAPDSVRQALALAKKDTRERDAFNRFTAALGDLLKHAWIPLGGRLVNLRDYLVHCDTAGSPGGDEASVVDVLVGEILAALGYGIGDVSPNRSLTPGEIRSVPDFTVRVQELLGTTPLFVVEDKATGVRDLHRTRRGRGAGAESPREQLRRYVKSGKVHGSTGLLCNGFRLEAWEFGPDGGACLVDVDLYGLAREWDGVGAPPLSHRPALTALFARFSRQSFALADQTAAETLKRPPLTPEVIARIQEGPLRSGKASELEAIHSAYLEEVWRQHAIDVARAPEQLVDSLRGLIELFAEDVQHQLDDALRRIAPHREELAGEERRADLEGILQRITLRRHNFDLSEEEFLGMCTVPLREWAQHPHFDGLRPAVANTIGTLEPHWKKLAVSGAPKKKVLAELAGDIDAYCRAALDLFAARERIEGSERASLRAARGYEIWKPSVSSSVLVGAPEETLRAEFARQTAYVYIVRLLLVRICEDKGLFRRKLSDGGLVMWFESAPRYLDFASGRSYDYLTRMAYECAQNIYVHFYGASELFDWYRMDDKMLLRALVVLNAFNLARIDTDVIGAVYGRYLIEGKHEQGRYFTPEPLVEAMLDLAGYRGGAVVNRRVLDPACGSGSFLVGACRRLLERYRDGAGKIARGDLETALKEVQRSLHGIDINPFACYLAETNLLIQVLDLVQQAQRENQHLPVERFAIFRADSLVVDEEVAAAQGASVALLLGEDQAVPELIKAKASEWQSGFDLVIANPPYVRADEEAPEYLTYRRILEGQQWFTTRHLKWDLYVPFVEQCHRLLSDSPLARACVVTIESLATAPYAARLRELLARSSTLHDVLFCEKLRLFTDAPWQDNIVLSFSRSAPGKEHVTRRWLCESRSKAGALELVARGECVQSESDPDRLFSMRAAVDLDLSETVRWEEICYVSVGMVLNSDEKVSEGEIIEVPATYEPERFGEELVEDRGKKGKRIRHRPFTKDELIAEHRDALHSRRFLDSRQVLRGGIGSVRWIEYGGGARCPTRVRRATFPELHQRPKIMFGTFTGVAVDEAKKGEHSIVSDSVRVAVRWCELEGIDNRSLADARGALEEEKKYRPDLSRDFSEWYLSAIALSEPIQKWLAANKRSMKEHVYPDDIKAIPVKRLSPAEQEPFIALARERHALWGELVALEEAGYQIGARVEVPVLALVARFREEQPAVRHATLFQLVGRGTIKLSPEFRTRSFPRARARGAQVIVDREVAIEVGEEIVAKERVALLFARFCAQLTGTFAEHQGKSALPEGEAGLLALLAFLEEEEAAVRLRKDRIAAIGQALDALAWEMYRPRPV